MLLSLKHRQLLPCVRHSKAAYQRSVLQRHHAIGLLDYIPKGPAASGSRSLLGDSASGIIIIPCLSVRLQYSGCERMDDIILRYKAIIIPAGYGP